MKVYNVIFPIWLILFFPPVIFITLIGNYLIDSIIIIVCFYVFKQLQTHYNLKTFYKKSIINVWIFGFLADIIGAAILMVLTFNDLRLGMSNELSYAISYDPFSHPLAVLIISIAMLISTALIFYFNFTYTFKKIIEDKRTRAKVALTIAIVTIPWTFLLPTKWFF